MLNKLIKKQNQKGFTLIELMVVIAIIGILAAIAIPQFAAYRQRSYVSALKSDAHTYADAQEAYYADNDTYCGTVSVLEGNTYGASHSSTDTVTITSHNANGFVMTFTDSDHSASVTYNSTAGGIQ